MSEIRTQIDQMVERLQILGATDAQINDVEAEWDTMPGEEREALWRSNDVALAARIAEANADDEAEERAKSPTPNVDAAVAEYKDGVAAQEDEDWELLGLRIETIMETVGADAERAYRLMQLEQSANKPRVTLIAALDEIVHPATDDPYASAADEAENA